MFEFIFTTPIYQWRKGNKKMALGQMGFSLAVSLGVQYWLYQREQRATERMLAPYRNTDI